jgi:hypothetical protein
MPRTTLVLACLSLLCGARVAASPDGPALPEDPAPPPLTATFDSVTRGHGHKPVRERFTLAREPRKIAYAYGTRFDVWSRSAARLQLSRLFPEERTSVEYTEGQLRALGSLRSWHQLGSLLPQPPARLGLKAVGAGSALQRKTQRFEGELNGSRISVQWLTAEQLPALLTIKNAHSERTTTLQKLVVGQAEAAPEPVRYRKIDAADLGDLEQDAFVKRHGALLHGGHQH